MGLIWTLSILAVGAVAGILLAIRRRRADWPERLLWACLPILLTTAGLRHAHEVVVGPTVVAWNDVRLAASVGLTYGYPLYSTAEGGTVQTTMYPPLSALAYVPAALASNPLDALRIGILLSGGYVFAPVLWLLLAMARQRAGGAPGRLAALVIFSCFVLLADADLGLLSNATCIHADAPALGFLMLACGLLSTGRESVEWFGRRPLAAAACAWLAVWSKQTMILPLCVLPVWVAASHGRRAGWRFLAMQAVTGLLVAVPLLAYFDRHGLLFNAWIIPGRYPWKPAFDPFPGYFAWAPTPRLVNLVIGCFDLGYRALFLGVLLLGAALLYRPSAADGDGGADVPPRRLPPWTLLLLVALSLFPISVLSYVKAGGALNSYGLTLYFLAAAVSVLVMDRACPPVPSADSLGSRATSSSLFAGLAALVALVQPWLWRLGNGDLDLAGLAFFFAGGLLVVLVLTRRWPEWPEPRRRVVATFLVLPVLTLAWNAPQQALRRSLEFDGVADRFKLPPSQLAYEYLRRHPGRAYFPCNPLAHLMAEGRLPHFLLPILERSVAGLPMSRDQIEAHLPPRFEEIVFPPGARGHGFPVEWMQGLLNRPLARSDRRILPGFEAYSVRNLAARPPGAVTERR